MDAVDPLMPDPQGRTPKLYEVEKGHKSESYIVAVTGNSVPPVAYSKDKGAVPTQSSAPASVPTTNLNSGEVLATQPKFALTLEEVEKFRNDPFWRVLRWTLFVLFWVAWVLMFIASILIVALSPKCPAITTPHWWESAVVYQIWTPSFQDSDSNGLGDFNGIRNRLEKVRRIGAQAVWVTPFVLTEDFYDGVLDHKDVDSKFGTTADVDKLIEEVHKKDLKMLVTMPIGVTSKQHSWFKKGNRKGGKDNGATPEHDNRSNLYRLKKQINVTSNLYYSQETDAETSETFYYAHKKNEPNRPALNWEHEGIRNLMTDIFGYWIDKGIDGFYLSGIEHMARSSNEKKAEWDNIRDILADLKRIVDTHTKKSVKAKDKKIVLFSTREDARNEDKRELVPRSLDSLVNNELFNISLKEKGRGTVASMVHEIIGDLLLYHGNDTGTTATWQLGSPWISRVASRMKSRAHAELLTMIQLLLPGANIFYYGEEIGMQDFSADPSKKPQQGAMQWDDSKNAGFSTADSKVPVNPDYKHVNWERQYAEWFSQLKMFRSLARLRKRDDALITGKAYILRKPVEEAFTIMRYKADGKNSTVGNIYIGAVNFGKTEVKLPLEDKPWSADSVDLTKTEVITATSNANGKFRPRQPFSLDSNVITVPPEQGIVIKLRP